MLFIHDIEAFGTELKPSPLPPAALRGERKRTSNEEAQNTKKPRPAAAEEDKENSGAAASIPVLGESGSGKTQTILGRSSKVGGWAFCGRTPCLLVWLRRRTLEEAPSGQSTGA